MFCIAEHHGIQEPKFRLIDDLTKSNFNKTAQMAETYCPHGLGSFAALTRLRRVNGANGLEQRSVDSPDAYKTSALRHSSAEDANICFLNPVDNRPYKCGIPAQPTGSRRAPANWGRVVAFLQFLARVLLPLAVGAYADCVFFPDGSLIAKSGFWAPKRLPALLGFNTSDRKGQIPSACIRLLVSGAALLGNAIRTLAYGGVMSLNDGSVGPTTVRLGVPFINSGSGAQPSIAVQYNRDVTPDVDTAYAITPGRSAF